MSKEVALARAQSLLLATENRFLLGVFGKPGVGKSTFTDYLSQNISSESLSVISMDGFHLSNRVLSAQGKSDRKGAPDTFDINGFVSLLRRVKVELSGPIYFPIFDRKIEESISGEGVVHAHARLIVVEGNYLCHEKDGWGLVKSLLDETWYLQVDDELRLRRLVDRHITFGKPPELADSWARGTDEQNAIVIGESAERADFIVQLN